MHMQESLTVNGSWPETNRNSMAPTDHTSLAGLRGACIYACVYVSMYGVRCVYGMYVCMYVCMYVWSASTQTCVCNACMSHVCRHVESSHTIHMAYAYTRVSKNVMARATWSHACIHTYAHGSTRTHAHQGVAVECSCAMLL
jgi:hypothetical protein